MSVACRAAAGLPVDSPRDAPLYAPIEGLDDALVESLERATLAAVAPARIATLPGWLLPMDSGGVGRASSAVPLAHRAPPAPETLVAAVEGLYAAGGARAVFRLADRPCFAGLQQTLAQQGYRRGRPTLTQIGTGLALRRMSVAQPGTLDDAPDAGWLALHSEGVSAPDGRARVAMLGRAPGSVYASVREGGEVLAAGVAAFGNGWCSIHGLRTGAAHRGRGLASRVLAALAQSALDRGVERIFLQVEAPNTGALALYARAGFSTAWCYEYWRRPEAGEV